MPLLLKTTLSMNKGNGLTDKKATFLIKLIKLLNSASHPQAQHSK